MKRTKWFAGLLAALFLVLSGCGPLVPDRPVPGPKTEEPEPENPEEPGQPEEPEQPQPEFVDVQAAFQGAGLIAEVKTFKHSSPHSGVDVSEIRYTDYNSKPQAVFVMQVDLSDKTVSMTNTVPGDAKTGFTGGREKLTAQFKRIDAAGRRVVGGVNTDFFVTTGDNAGEAQGAFWHKSTCLKDKFNSQATRPRCFVYWGVDDRVYMAPSADYSTVKARGGFQELFSGGQFLVDKGKATNFIQDSVYGVHPRTMFGIGEDHFRVILVVLDGRDDARAVGMNYPDMQKILLSLGCETALNIDGGGSSTFVVRSDKSTGYGQSASFTVLNNPSDGTERAIGPGLAILALD